MDGVLRSLPLEQSITLLCHLHYNSQAVTEIRRSWDAKKAGKCGRHGQRCENVMLSKPDANVQLVSYLESRANASDQAEGVSFSLW